MTDVVLVHGAFADGSGWRSVYDRLTSRGHRVTVLDKADRLGGTMWFSTLTTPDNEPLVRFFAAARLTSDWTIELLAAGCPRNFLSWPIVRSSWLYTPVRNSVITSTDS